MLKRSPLTLLRKGRPSQVARMGFRFRKPLPAIDTGGILDFRPESIVSFYLVNSSVPKFDRLGSGSAAASGAATELDVCAIHIEAVTIFAFNFLKFRDAATERTALKRWIRLSWFAHPSYSALPINFAIIRFVLAEDWWEFQE